MLWRKDKDPLFKLLRLQGGTRYFHQDLLLLKSPGCRARRSRDRLRDRLLLLGMALNLLSTPTLEYL